MSGENAEDMRPASLVVSRVPILCHSSACGLAFVMGKAALEDKAGLAPYLLPLLLQQDDGAPLQTMRVIDLQSGLSEVWRVDPHCDADACLRGLLS